MVLRMIVAYAHSMNHVPYAVVANKPDIHQTQTNGNDKTIQAITERSPAVPLAVDFQLPQLVRLGFSFFSLAAFRCQRLSAHALNLKPWPDAGQQAPKEPPQAKPLKGTVYGRTPSASSWIMPLLHITTRPFCFPAILLCTR